MKCSYLFENNSKDQIFTQTIHMVCNWMKKIHNFEKSISLLITDSNRKKTNIDDIITLLDQYK